MVKFVGGKKCTCGNILDSGVAHHFDGTPCYVMTAEDFEHIMDGMMSSVEEWYHEDREPPTNSRPCDSTFTDAVGNTWTPDLINKFASKPEAMAAYFCENKDQLTKDDIIKICEAIRDNWSRFWASC